MATEIMQTVEQLNSKVSQLNNERSRQLGMQEAAKEQYSKAIAAYKMKYGVELTEANLQEEYNKVFAEAKGNIVALQTTIESIERGDYKNVERPADIDLNPNVAIPQPQPKANVAPPVQSQPTPVVEQPVVNGPISFGGVGTVEPTAQPVAQPAPSFGFGGDLGATVQPVAQPQQAAPADIFGTGFGGNLGVQQTVAPVEAPKAEVIVDSEEEEAFKPTGWGESKGNAEINKNFADILNTSGVKFGAIRKGGNS